MKDFQKCIPTRWGRHLARAAGNIRWIVTPINGITRPQSAFAPTHTLSMASALEDGYYIKL
jgi:hypothetical protein